MPTFPLLQPEKLDRTFMENIRVLQPDFFVVAAYAKIIPSAILEIPRLGTLGVHPSLLPKYRGASPIQSAILDGEPETGTTIFVMDTEMDHGPILASQHMPIASDKTYSGLEEDLAELSGELLVSAIPAFLGGKITPKPQDHARATYTKKFETIDGFVEEKELDAALDGDAAASVMAMRKIRALNPDPGAWTIRGGKRVKLLKAKIEGTTLVLIEIQIEGERPKELH